MEPGKEGRLYTVLTVFPWLCWLGIVALYVVGGFRGLRQLAALAVGVVLVLVGNRLDDSTAERAYEWWLKIRKWGELDRR